VIVKRVFIHFWNCNEPTGPNGKRRVTGSSVLN
jgi:hypothetical protein